MKNVRDLRDRVLAALGGVCVAEGCGIAERDLLTIDHRYGGGSAHRRAVGSGHVYYTAILKQLDDYQLLCFNHNHLKRLTDGEDSKRWHTPNRESRT